MKLLLLLNLLFLSAASFSATDSLELDSIVIKGSKEKKKYNETNSSITVLKDETIKSAAQDTSINAINGEANVQVNKNGESFSIRGINNTGVTGYQKDNLASIIIDDVFQTDLAIKAGSFDLWDLERIEIHRGAQSTIQGVNSLAGTIFVNHNTPVLFNEGKAKIGYGTFNHKEVGVVTNNEIIRGKVAMRLSYNKETSDGYITNVTTHNDKWGQKNRDNFDLGVLYQLSDDDKLLFDLKILRNKTGGTYVQGSSPFFHQVSEDVDFSSRVNNQQGSIRYIKKANENWSNVLITAFTQSKLDELSDADGTPTSIAGKRLEDHADQFMSVENLLSYKSEKISNTIGFNVHNYKLLDHYDFNLLYPLGGGATTPIFTLQDVKKIRTVYSVFDSFNYDFNEHHSLNLGGRFEVAQNKYGTSVIAVRTQNLGAANSTVDAYLKKSSGIYGGDESNVQFLPKLGYLFHLDHNHFGASFTQAYRSGGLSINRSRALAVNYSPEKTDNYELSHKYENKMFNLASNIFYTNWRDQQVQVSLSSDFYDTQVENASRSELYGAEVQGQYFLNPSNTLSLNAGYVLTRFVDFKKGSQSYTGKEFPNAPHLTSMLTYKTKLTDSFAVNTVARFLGKSFSNAENTKEAPNQYYIDLNTEYNYSSFGIEVFVRNILNKKYLIYDGSPSAALASTNSGYQVSYNQINTPREIGGRVNYYW
jgi:iron complex outermembrane receptor protein